MNTNRHTKDIPWTGIITALLGACFCVYASSDHGNILCLTAGCQLNRNFAVGGISAWHAGIAAFGLYAASALLFGRKAARILSTLFLAGDCLFLLLMGFTLPCIPCLAAAVFFAALALASQPQEKSATVRRPLLLVWTFLFLFNVFLLAREYAMPAPMYGSDSAKIKLYFSPTCPHCREAVRRYSTLAQKGEAALYPVAEREGDMAVLESMSAEAAAGVPPEIALEHALASHAPRVGLQPSALSLFWQTRANHAAVLAHGNGAVPLVIQEGIALGARPRQESFPDLSADIFDSSLHTCEGANADAPCAPVITALDALPEPKSGERNAESEYP